MTGPRVLGLGALIPELRRASLRAIPRPGQRAELGTLLAGTASRIVTTLEGTDYTPGAEPLAAAAAELQRAALVLLGTDDTEGTWSPDDLTACADRLDHYNYAARRVIAGRMAARAKGLDYANMTDDQLAEHASDRVLSTLDAMVATTTAAGPTNNRAARRRAQKAARR